MKASRIVCMVALSAIAGVAGGRQASAQQPATQYYGYTGKQAPMASAQANYACVPGTGCVPDKYGCVVTVCPCPCQTPAGCIPGIPDIHAPSCQNPCVIINEGPPTTRPITYDIYRNCYVPLRIDFQPGPSNIQPVNINVKWREVHFLCGPDGKPLPAQQAAAVLKELQDQIAAGGTPNSSTAAPVAQPVPNRTVTPATNATTNTTQAAPAPARAPQKQWIWVSNMNMYGFGYIREDGYAIIDEGSYRAQRPAQAASTPTQEGAGTVVTTASNSK
jgi:hypothetical protein